MVVGNLCLVAASARVYERARCGGAKDFLVEVVTTAGGLLAVFWVQAYPTCSTLVHDMAKILRLTTFALSLTFRLPFAFPCALRSFRRKNQVVRARGRGEGAGAGNARCAGKGGPGQEGSSRSGLLARVFTRRELGEVVFVGESVSVSVVA